MKQSIVILAAAFVLNASTAQSLSPAQVLDDSTSFVIAKSVKLGYGETTKSTAPTTGKRPELNVCSSDADCLATQKCVDGKCEDVCTSTTCSGETPDCEVNDHSYTCKCTETSCGANKKCVDGSCEPCTTGSKCNCDGEKVLGSDGTCVCPANVSCSEGQYVSGDCSCKSCSKDDTANNKCNCPGKTYPDGSGGCYCQEKKSCGEGYSFDSTNTCECVPCTDNNNCDNPCPAGSFPNGNGCGTYVCVTDDNCAAGNFCQNGGTESAECVPCGKNEQCRCPDGQLSDGTGKCVPVACKADLVCSDSVTEQCCDAGMQCVNPDTVESYCAACEVDTQCTCPDGYVVNREGKCVKPACQTNNDCAAGKYCENAGKSDAECVPCQAGEPCPTCPTGYVSDGNGGCKLGCTFDSASACVSGTSNCKTCSTSGGCYTCTECKDGYYADNGVCVSCTQKFGDNCKKCNPSKCITCSEGYTPDAYTGTCVPKACPDGYATDVSCDTTQGYAYTTNGISGTKQCGKCSPTACPTNTATSISCSAGKKAQDTSSYSGGSVCKQCVSCAAGATDCGCSSGQVADGNGGCKTLDPCENVSCDGGKVCSAGSCVCPDGTAWYNNKCRKVGCPSAYSDHYDMLKKGSDCKLSPNGELLQIGPDVYTLCAKCTPYSCPTATMLPDKLQNCKTTKGSGSYSGYMECVECSRCDTGYYLFMGKCLKCVNATCDGTDSATCNPGYQDGHISTDATQYICTKSADCACSSASTGTYVGTVGSDRKVSFSDVCTKTPSGTNGCSYESIRTYIQLNDWKTSVTGVGDTRISCSISGSMITCKHTYESAKSFKVIIPSNTEGSVGIPIGGNISPQCPSSDIYCAGKGCCPKHANGCSEYANDCKSVGNGLYTACRCILYDTTSKITN